MGRVIGGSRTDDRRCWTATGDVEKLRYVGNMTSLIARRTPPFGRQMYLSNRVQRMVGDNNGQLAIIAQFTFAGNDRSS